MVQFKISSSLLFLATLLVTFANLVSADVGRPTITVRDIVDHELFSRDLRYHELITRDEIEEVFGRELDTEVTTFFQRDLDHIYARHPDKFANFFECIGDFVKRFATLYWRHMKIQAYGLVGQDDGRMESELDFLPRDYHGEDEFDPKPEHEREHEFLAPLPKDPSPHPIVAEHPGGSSWFLRSLIRYRDAMLKYDEQQSHMD